MHAQHEHSGMSWRRFAAMIATSTAIMFFLMYQLVYTTEDAAFSWNRMIASLVMACVMAVVMLGFMWSMYKNRTAKISVLIAATLVGGALLYINRSQAIVDDVRFMKAMIPHHSIAVNNARKASITDPRVRELADQIIESQVREIELMKRLVDDIQQHGSSGSEPLAPRATVVTPRMEREIQAALQR